MGWQWLKRPRSWHRDALAALVLASSWATLSRADDPGHGLQLARGEANSASAAEGRNALTEKRIGELIGQLGSPHYTVRRSAANALRQIGAEAFDLLYAATAAADPEVAASAQYLLHQIAVRWVQSDDPPAVRRLLRAYGNQSDEKRLLIIQELARLPNHEGVPALCRVARFDRSPLLARVAALAIIRPDVRDAKHSALDPEMMDRELGESTRITTTWLRQYRRQLRDPAATVADWLRSIDEEVELLARNGNETNDAIGLGLMWNLANIYQQIDNRPALMEVVDQMMRLDSNSMERTTVDLLLWLVELDSWDAVEEFLTKYDAQLAQAKRPLYIAALARAKQGKQELAEELAEKASKLDPQQTLESFMIAKELELRNQYDWSVREYRQVVGNKPVASHEAILARISLANLQHDHEQYESAADAIEPLVKAIQQEGNVGQLYTEIRRYHLRQSELALPEREAVAAKLHHYRACQYHAAGDWQKEREHLEMAIRFVETDAEVVIAMHRLPESDEKWREMVRQRIRDLCRQFQQEIDGSPNDPTAYNQWAWLVANTEGDFQQAVRYSRRSLELLGLSAGDSARASFLDTLGRCYYAAGDLDNAVKCQREAIEKLDSLQVMHRQLALFEQALAEKQGGKEPGVSGKN